MQTRRRWILMPAAAAAAALLAALPAGAVDFSQAWFFGDSLSDTGTVGRFTTSQPGDPGLVWTEDLAAKFGLSAAPVASGGTDFAFGGARIYTDVGPIEAVATQVTNYLTATGGKADPNALYSVWGGPNDIFFATTLPATSVTGYLFQTTAQEVGVIQALHDAGARYIVVPTLPDMGATPAAVLTGPAATSALTTLASAYNGLLYGQLRNAGIGVIAPDTFTLMHEVEANPNAYGIFVTTAGWACSSANPPAGQVVGGAAACALAPLNPPGDASIFMFADGIHPSSITHRILGDYVYSVIVAPVAMSLLAETPVRMRSGLDETLVTQAGRGDAAGTRMWVNVDGGRLKYGSGADAPADARPGGFAIGYDQATRFGRLGLALSGSQVQPDWSGLGRYRQTELALSVYANKSLGDFGASVAATLGHLSYATRRDVVLGPALRRVDGSTHGSDVSLAAQFDYTLHSGRLAHGPLLGIDLQHVDVAAFSESTAAGASTSMTYGAQSRNALIGRVGYQLAWEQGRWTPYARASYEHDFASRDRNIEASLASVAGSGWTMPAARVDVNAGNVALGSRWQLAPGVDAWLELGDTFGRSDVTQYGARLGVRYTP